MEVMKSKVLPVMHLRGHQTESKSEKAKAEATAAYKFRRSVDDAWGFRIGLGDAPISKT